MAENANNSGKSPSGWWQLPIYAVFVLTLCVPALTRRSALPDDSRELLNLVAAIFGIALLWLTRSILNPIGYACEIERRAANSKDNALI